MFSMYRPVVYGDGGLKTITACVCVNWTSVSLNRQTLVTLPNIEAHGFCHPFIDFRYFGVCVCGRERNDS
jgi:hypothetical protein